MQLIKEGVCKDSPAESLRPIGSRGSEESHRGKRGTASTRTGEKSKYSWILSVQLVYPFLRLSDLSFD